MPRKLTAAQLKQKLQNEAPQKGCCQPSSAPPSCLGMRMLPGTRHPPPGSHMPSTLGRCTCGWGPYDMPFKTDKTETNRARATIACTTTVPVSLQVPGNASRRFVLRTSGPSGTLVCTQSPLRFPWAQS